MEFKHSVEHAHFEEKIKELIKSSNLDRKQIFRFAWICGLRALPFSAYAVAGWDKESSQQYLGFIFYTLDNTAQAAFLDNSFISAVDVACVIDNAAKAAADAIVGAYAAAAYAKQVGDYMEYDKYADAARTAAYVYKVGEYVEYADAVRAYAAVSDAARLKLELEPILLDDIKAIKNNKLNECNNDINLYGKVWDIFQACFKINDCAYWLRLYEDLFKNGFDTLDKEELKLRLSVPYAITAEGAAAVARQIIVMKEQGTADGQQ